MQLLPASILPGLLDVALKGRVNVQLLFDSAGIDPEVVGCDDRYITIEQLDMLLSRAFTSAGDEDFGLQVGRDNHHSNLGLLGSLMATSASLRQALDVFFRYKDLLVPYLQFRLEEKGPLARLSVAPDDSLQFARTRIHNDVIVASMVAIGRSLLGGDMGLLGVSFRHGEPHHLEIYRRYFDCPLRFSHAFNEIALKADRLDQPLPATYPKYHQRLLRSADQQLSGLLRAQGVSGQVLDMLRTQLCQGNFSVEKVADGLHMSARTLQRRLRQEGTSFAQLRDRLRHAEACRMLLEESCDMGMLAGRLGFSDNTNFYHAFRRWQGCAPGAYRRKYLQAD